MRIMKRSRRATAVALLSVLWFTDGCFAYQRPRGPLAPGSRIRVTAKAPMLLSPGVPSPPESPGCQATQVEATVQQSSGDTLTLHKIRRLRLGDAAATCPTAAGLTLVTTGLAAEVNVRRLSSKRTAFLVLGVLAVAILVVPVPAGGDEDPYGTPCVSCFP